MNVAVRLSTNSSLDVQASSSSSVSNEEVIPESIVDRLLLLEHNFDGQKCFIVTDLDKAKEILQMPRNGPYISSVPIEQVVGVEQAVGIEDLADFSTLTVEYFSREFPNRNFIFKSEDFIFTCSPYRNEDFHTFIAQNFFNPTCLSSLPERSADLATKMVSNGEAEPFAWGSYAERGVIELLKDKEGNDLVTAMRKDGCTDVVCFLLLLAALLANSQIGIVIDEVLSKCNENMELCSRIRNELEVLRQTMPLWQAATESPALRSLIYEALRTSRPLKIKRETRMGEQIRIDLGSFMPFDANRFASYTSNFAPGLPYLPFGFGPNMCPGWRLAMIQITQMMAVLLCDDLEMSDISFCPVM